MARSATARSAAGHGLSDDAGFTLVETVVAFTIFMILVGSATFWLVKTIQLTGTTRNRVAAANLAAQEVETIRGAHNNGKQLDATTHDVKLHNTTFTVTPALSPGADDDCPTGSTRRVTVTVTWNGSAKPVRYASVLAC